MPSSRTFLTAGLLVATCASVVYWLLTLRWLRRYLSGDAAAQGNERVIAARPFAPFGSPPAVTFFRSIKRGVPRLREKLEMLVSAALPGDQIVLGADAGSLELAIAEQARAAFPQSDLAVVACTPRIAANPKISKLIQMQAAARHAHWIITDSEALLSRAFCDSFRSEWQHCDVLTAGYRITGLKSCPQQLDAAAVLLTLWPGLAVIGRSGGPRFTLGACTALRAADLAQVGGLSAFGIDLAEDHQIGVALARAGKRIRLSREVVALESDRITWRDYWRHQRRVAVTYRVSNPRGFAGMALVFGLPWSLLLAFLHRRNPLAWAWFAFVWLIRWRTARLVARHLGFDIHRLPLVVFIASFVEAICAAASWVDRRVWWVGWQQVSRSGKIEPIS